MLRQPDRVRRHAFISAPAEALILAACTALTLLPLPAQATTAAGRTVGSFSVSSTGAATYTIPIWAPPGPQGMQPNIALAYNSQRHNGIVGVGWSVSGLSSIYRCNLTVAQDAAPAPVALVTSDGYCMDGQRLRLTSSGNYGENGSTYQTEIANFVNVTAHGSAGNGPSYFTAQDRNGRTYTYGNGGNSQVVLNGTAASWQLNEVSDPAGNTMTIAYLAGSIPVPSQISWTPSAYGSTTYNYSMNLTYQTLAAPVKTGYLAGQSVQTSYLLSKIGIYYQSVTEVKTYFLGYTASSTTGQETLTSVTECEDAQETTCLLPTTIHYQSGQAGVASTPTPVPGVLTTLLYDFNGDGRPDAAYFNNGVLYVALNTGSGFATPINTGITDTSAMFGDVLGAGSDGILANNGGTFYYYTYSASTNSFSGVSTGVTVQASYTYVLTDITGDGLPDLVGLFGLTDQMVTVQNTSSGGVLRFGTPYNFTSTFTTGNKRQLISAVSGHPKPNRYLDFNGDGRNDVFVETTNWTQIGPGEYDFRSTYYQLISQGANAPFQVVQVSFDSTGGQSVVFGNFNDDSCSDVAVGLEVYYSACNGTIGTVVTLSGSDPVMTAIDWDGDGRIDLLAGSPGSVLNWYHSTGSGFASEVSTGYTLASTCVVHPTAVDVNGDGLEDLNCQDSYYLQHNGSGQPPDLLSSVADGYGNSASPTYVSIVQGNYTEGTSTQAGYENYIGPMYVVKQVTFSDPSTTGGTYYQNYSYSDGWLNLQGRGFTGFQTVQSYDSRNALWELHGYMTTFPYIGDSIWDAVSFDQAVNQPIKQTYASNAEAVTLASTQYQQRYFIYNNTTTQINQVSWSPTEGSVPGPLIETDTTTFTNWDNYGNPGTITLVRMDNDSNSPYNGQSWTTAITNTPDVDTSHWCLGLFTETQVAYTSNLSGSNPVTRTKTRTPDTTHCRYTQIVTEPNSSQFKVTEVLAYDSFGNVNSDTVTGINMTARTTLASWTNSSVTTGQFPMSVTDPTNATTQFNYNLSYGLKSSVTDPNGVTASWSYTDGFGRLTQETRPDGTYARYTYQNCSGTTGCLVGSDGLVVGHTVYNTDASYQSSGTVYFDSVGRQLVANQVMLSGYSRNEVRYDSLGRVSQSAFPCSWSSLTTTCSYWRTNSYDVLNRLTQSQRPISSTNSNPQTTTYAYAGRTTTVTDPQSNARTTVTDVNGWLRQTKDPMGYSVTMAYDSAGSKTKVTDSLGNPLWSGTYNYGLSAYLASATDMDMGSWGFTNDALGEMAAWTDAKAQSFSETYDALSRPRTRTDPDLFTQWTWGSSASNYNIGKLQSKCTGTGSSCSSSGYSESETYDSLGRRSQRTITLSGYSPFTYTWGYSSTTGLLNTLTYPTSTSGYALKLQYAYANGVLQAATDISDTPNVTVWTANTMDPAGHVTEETLGNGIETNRSFDAVTQWLGTAQSGVGGGASVKNLSFLYDEIGNVTQRQDNNLGLTENIYYDNDYRFSYSKLNGTQNLSVTYDSTGNITSRSDVAGGASWTYDPNHKHEVTQAGSSGFQYSYDANGNAITRQGSTITWSSYNYPTTINAGTGATAETVAFSYSPERQRWQQMYTGNSTQETTYYIGGLMEVVASGSVTDYRHYILVPGEQIAVYSRKSSGTNTFSYLLSDHQAGVASITNSSGAQVVGESFDAFGSRRNGATWSGAPSNSDLTTIAGITREGYTFQTALGLWMGMNHMNGRVEDSITGRMLSADPNVPNPANAQSYNRYSYVNNNPLRLIDPSGFAACLINKTAFKTQQTNCSVVGGDNLGGAIFGWDSYDGFGNVGSVNPMLSGSIAPAGPDLSDGGGASDAGSSDGGSAGPSNPNSSFQNGVNVNLLGRAVANAFDNTMAQITDENAPVDFWSLVADTDADEANGLAAGGWAFIQGQVNSFNKYGPLSIVAGPTVGAVGLFGATGEGLLAEGAGGGATLLFHGTDAVSAGDIMANGINLGRAAELGGGDVFWTTTSLSDAGWFAASNPAGGVGATLRISVPNSVINNLTSSGLLSIQGSVFQFQPGAMSILNNAANFALVP